MLEHHPFSFDHGSLFDAYAATPAILHSWNPSLRLQPEDSYCCYCKDPPNSGLILLVIVSTEYLQAISFRYVLPLFHCWHVSHYNRLKLTFLRQPYSTRDCNYRIIIRNSIKMDTKLNICFSGSPASMSATIIN
jgi:hypothetical protein